jgi:protein farnesyltransferase/geranylgeranyltransferase type-1 subunit alpha
MDELAVKFLKTYQVWHHRRLLVTITRKAKQELAFIQKGLQVDEKNYHTWSYRQWILAHFGGTGNNTTTTTKSTTTD